MGQPTPPAWSTPPAQPPPPPKQSAGRRIGKPIAIGCAAILAFFLIGGIIAAVVGGNTKPTTQAPAEPSPAAGPKASGATAAPQQAAAQIGQTLTAKDVFDRDVAQITVDRIRTTRGDEFNKPDNGVYLIAHVRVKALRNNVGTPDLYVLQGGEKFPQTFTGLDVGQALSYTSLAKGETQQGNLAFDIRRAKGGRIVLPKGDGTPVAYWAF